MAGMFEKLKKKLTRPESRKTLRKMTGQPEPFTPPEGADMGGEHVKESREARLKRKMEEAAEWQKKYNKEKKK